MKAENRNKVIKPHPDQSFELVAHFLGFKRVCGVDEAGRGPLAGPVVAAAVVLPLGCVEADINDSKRMSAAQRERMFDLICGMALDYHIGVVGPDVIDEKNILRASLLAMQRAVEGLRLKPDFLLVDGNFRMRSDIPQQCIVHGDSVCFSVAAASILAKCHRDNLMREFEEEYPGYGFARHKGYGTRDHIRSLHQLGPTPIHRRTFAPVREALEEAPHRDG